VLGNGEHKSSIIIKAIVRVSQLDHDISMKDHIEIFGNLEAEDRLVLTNDELKPGTAIIRR
jgi:hypothetical protein